MLLINRIISVHVLPETVAALPVTRGSLGKTQHPRALACGGAHPSDAQAPLPVGTLPDGAGVPENHLGWLKQSSTKCRKYI